MAINTKKTKKPSRVGLSRTWKRVGEQYQETSEPYEFSTNPAVVKMLLSRTINLGNYESIRAEVGVEIPCYVEEINPALKEAQRICEDELSTILDDIGAK